MGRYTTGGVGRDVLAGALAGGAAVWLISKMDWSLDHTGRADRASTGPASAAAGQAADAAGVRMNPQQTQAAARTVHYGIGIGIGALYGLLRGMAPSVTTGRGSLFGVATFILGDEIGAPALGLARGPLEYAARDHAKSALAHVVFGVLTDLGTRLLSPWKSEVVITRGPPLTERLEDGRDYLQETGRGLLEQGRSYLDQGRELVSEYAEQARDRLEELDVPSRLERGRKQAKRFAEDVRSRLPDSDDLADVAETGRRRARNVADRVASRLPDRDDVEDAVETGRSRARGWFRTAASRLPDRDDVEDAVSDGHRRARSLAKEARKRLPDRDDVDEAIDDGRKRVRRLADSAQDTGSSLMDRASRWLFG